MNNFYKGAKITYRNNKCIVVDWDENRNEVTLFDTYTGETLYKVNPSSITRMFTLTEDELNNKSVKGDVDYEPYDLDSYGESD